MVVNFNGKRVQMPSVNAEKDYVYVEYKDGRYLLVTEDKYKRDLEDATSTPRFSSKGSKNAKVNKDKDKFTSNEL